MLIFCIILLIAGVTGFIMATLKWDQYVSYNYVTSLRRPQPHLRPSGWPYTVRTLSGWIIALTGLSTIINVIVMVRTKTAYAINKNGLIFLLPGALKPFFAEWKDISSIQEFSNSQGKGVTVHFHSIDDLIKKQGGKSGKYISKRPVSIHPTTAKGDTEGFISMLQTRFRASQTGI